MNILKKIPITIISTLLFIVLPFIVVTLITSRTSLIFDIRSFVVLSGSMQPIFPVGSMVYGVPQSEYKAGDIITFTNKAGENVTHRITTINKKNNQITFTTKGDANNTSDQTPVTKDKIIGKIFFFVPYIGLLVNLLKSPLYFIGLIIIPSIIFIAIELRTIKNEIVKITEKRVLERVNKQT